MKKVLVIHPFLFALFPVLFVYAQNMEHLFLSQTWPLVPIVLVLTLVVWIVLSLILRNLARAGILVSLFLILFFSCGPARHLLPTGRGWTWLLAIVWSVIFVAGVYGILRVKKNLQDVTKILNVVALTLVMISLFNIGSYELRARAGGQDGGSAASLDLTQQDPVPAGELPDIYYIILDGYGRADILQELYGYDDSEFLNFLEQEGFYVADGSQANYGQTALSLASALNLNYLDELVAHLDPKSTARLPLKVMIQDSTLFQFLRQQGYQIVAFPSEYDITNLATADVHVGTGPLWNEFESGLLASTPLPWLATVASDLDFYGQHADTISHILHEIAGTSELPGPNFVFAHVLAPHPPFVFDEEGNRIDPGVEFTLVDGSYFFDRGQTPEEYVEGYKAQVAFISAEIRAALKELIARQSRPAIIIVQSDHGPGLLLDWDEPENTYFRERLSILNAYLLPGGGEADLYKEISPVNTFRVILNRYFGTDLELLEDKSFYSAWDRPYEFIDVTDEIRSGEPAP